MIPFKCAFVLNREVLKRPLISSFLDSLLCEIGFRENMRRWKNQMLIWDKIKDHAEKSGVTGEVATIKLSIK